MCCRNVSLPSVLKLVAIHSSKTLVTVCKNIPRRPQSNNTDSSDLQITDLKAKHFTVENELRNKMKNIQKEHENKVETLSQKIKSLQKEVAMLSKSGKKQMLLAARDLGGGGGGGGSGSGTDSPSLA
jgi:TolA-binding protein